MKKIVNIVVLAGLTLSVMVEASDLAGPYLGGQLAVAQPSMTIEDSDCFYNCSAYTQRKNGALLGVQGGYNWISDGLLLGGELEYNAGSIEKKFDYSYYTGPKQRMKLTSTMETVGSVRVKAGLVSGNTAVIVSAGPALGSFEGEFRNQNNTIDDRSDDDVAKQSGDLMGLAYGMSIEHAWTSNLLVSFRYSHYDFEDEISVVKNSAGVTTGNLIKFVNETSNFSVGAAWSF